MRFPASPFRFLLAPALLVATSNAAAVAPPVDLARSARDVLRQHCLRCHDVLGRAKGGLTNIADLHNLVQRGLVVPGKPNASPLYQRVHEGEMPPPGKRNTLSAADRELLRDWIIAGAPSDAAPPQTKRLGEDEALLLVLTDLKTLPPRQRRFSRYVTLGHLGGRPVSEQQTVRAALGKLVNSLSWHARLSVPLAVDPGRLVYRLDLRHYRWTARQWDRLAATYPYAISPGANHTPGSPGEAAVLAGCDQPLVRADWFIATASRPPFYHDFLQMPSSDRALERLLQVDVPGNIEDETALRAGFNGSGVARANRLLERHDAAHGAYWRSYDFSDNTSRQNLFQYPLGPAPGPASFQHAGGEIVFHLPNGLQGYMLIDRDGRRIDRAPAEIVRDPRRPDQIVENGLSCIGCHVQGILPKDDQVRAHVQKNLHAFTREQRETILGLYVPAARLRAAMKEDNERFAAALKRLDVPIGEPEPIAAVVGRFEEVLDLRRAADEAGVSAEVLAGVLRRSEDLGRTLGPLTARGRIQRQVFEEAFPRLLAVLPPHLPTPSPKQGEGEKEGRALIRDVFRGHRGSVRALAWAPDGKSFASAGDDGSVRVWDVATGKDRLMAGRSEEPIALVFSPDGRRLLSGGADRRVDLWDTSTGRRIVRLVGHTAGVRAVAITPDGKLALSAGEDRTIRVWDLDRREQLRTLTAHTSRITSLAISLDGKHVLSGGADRTVRLWDLSSGKLLARHDYPGEVHAVAFSRDGKSIFAGGTDRGVSIQAADGAAWRKRLVELAGTVAGIAVTWDGDLLTASLTREEGEQSLRVVNLATGKARAVGPAGVVEAAAVAADGTALLAMGGVIHQVSVSR